MQVEYPVSKMLKTRSILHFGFGGVHLHIHDETSWGWNPNLNMYVSYIVHAQSLKAILYEIFSAPGILTATNDMSEV